MGFCDKIEFDSIAKKLYLNHLEHSFGGFMHNNQILHLLVNDNCTTSESYVTSQVINRDTIIAELKNEMFDPSDFL